jgi:tellurite methyltransferase
MTDDPGVTAPGDSLLEQFGNIDVYLFDQILRGRITPDMTILDAGCGEGRNLVYFLRAGYDVAAVDQEAEAVDSTRALARRIAPEAAPDRFRTERLDALSFPDASFDVVIANAVLHFAPDETAFHAMVGELWRVLRPGGLLFARLASSIGLEDRVQLRHGRWHLLPDGTERFLVDEAFLLRATSDLGGELLDPIKTVNVQGRRCMTTWVVRKQV